MELSSWLALHQAELKAATQAEPLISALLARGDKVIFVAAFLTWHKIAFDWDDTDSARDRRPFTRWRERKDVYEFGASGSNNIIQECY